MAFAEIIKAGKENRFVKPIGRTIKISKAYLELNEPLKDGETVTLQISKIGVPGEGVICARFSNTKDGVSLNITVPYRKLCQFFVDGPPSARVHLTGFILDEPKEPAPIPIELRPRRCEI